MKKHYIKRTERISRLKKLLEDYRYVYISSFFSCGKTVLLRQFEESLDSNVLWFDAAVDVWEKYKEEVKRHKEGVLILDSLHMFSDIQVSDMFRWLAGLPSGIKAVMAGRAQVLDERNIFPVRDEMIFLGREYVLFDREEIIQLFLNYDITLKPAEITFLEEHLMGWAYGMQAIAARLKENPELTVLTLNDDVMLRLMSLLINNVLSAFTEQECQILYSMSPFESFSEEMARVVTGIPDAPEIMSGIVHKSYMLMYEGGGEYFFISFVRKAVWEKAKNRYTVDEINALYSRAAEYYESHGNVRRAAQIYSRLGDMGKLRYLFARASHMRPAEGGYVELRDYYKLLPEEDILNSPELMKIMCMIESLTGCKVQSEEWYDALKAYIKDTPAKDAGNNEAREAVAYLDIALPHRGSGRILKILLATAKLGRLTKSDSWSKGFNVAGYSVSLLNGGKDFCRWIPRGEIIYRMFRKPVELALGRSGRGLADISMGECILESSLDGEYSRAMDLVCAGIVQSGGDLELCCAAAGIQSRILMAQGEAEEASGLLAKKIESLPENAPARLVTNLEAYRLILELIQGNTDEAYVWLGNSAPNEQEDFIILDRYSYMLKLRLYILKKQWGRTSLLISRLKYYYDEYDRPYMRIRLHILQAVIYRRTGNELWREELLAALRLAKRYSIVRVIADEGMAILDMIEEINTDEEIIRETGLAGEWYEGMMELLRRQAAFYPRYLRPVVDRPEFSDREYQIYSLLVAGYDNKKIASVLNVTVATVKHYLTGIYHKLDVKSRSEAVARAAELGDM